MGAPAKKWKHADGTVVFVDLSGSTGLWEQEREAAFALVRGWIDSVVRIGVKRHGVKVKEIGDEVMFWFEGTRKESLERAIRGAVAIQQAWRKGPAAVKLDPPKIGIHVVQGGFAVDGGDVLGRDVNRAARLVGAAEAGQVLVAGLDDQDVQAALKAVRQFGILASEPVETEDLKGVAARVRVRAIWWKDERRAALRAKVRLLVLAMGEPLRGDFWDNLGRDKRCERILQVAGEPSRVVVMRLPTVESAPGGRDPLAILEGLGHSSTHIVHPKYQWTRSGRRPSGGQTLRVLILGACAANQGIVGWYQKMSKAAEKGTGVFATWQAIEVGALIGTHDMFVYAEMSMPEQPGGDCSAHVEHLSKAVSGAGATRIQPLIVVEESGTISMAGA